MVWISVLNFSTKLSIEFILSSIYFSFSSESFPHGYFMLTVDGRFYCIFIRFIIVNTGTGRFNQSHKINKIFYRRLLVYQIMLEISSISCDSQICLVYCFHIVWVVFCRLLFGWLSLLHRVSSSDSVYTHYCSSKDNGLSHDP